MELQPSANPDNQKRKSRNMAFQFVFYIILLAIIGHTFYRLVVVRYMDYQASGLQNPDQRDNSPNQQQRDSILGCQHGCELPPELCKKWPLGIDRIIGLWTSNSDGRLLAFLCSVAKGYEPGNSLCQYLLFGPRAFHVLRPENVEVVLSTNFKGSP